MKVFKTITKILMIIIFILSVAFNILIYGSSYGTLIFKHDDAKLTSLVYAKRLNLEPSYFLVSKNKGLEVKKQTQYESTITDETFKIHVDGKSKVTVFLEDDNKVNYYKDGVVYDKDGNKVASTLNELTAATAKLDEFNLLLDFLIKDIETSKNKTSIDFSFSPFYFIGFKYTIKEEERTLTYNFDLNGNLRKIQIEDYLSNTTDYLINYENTEIKIPTSTR